MSEHLKIKIRSLSHKVSWLAGTRLSYNDRSVFVTGYPKSGTTWVSQLVSECLDLPYPRNTILPILYPAVLHGHDKIWKSYRRGIYVIRDGRDALISFYFHLAKNLPYGENIKLNIQQSRLFPGLKNKNDVSANIATFIEGQMKHPHSSPYNWAEHISQFQHAKNPRIQIIRYEDLINNNPAKLKEVLDNIETSNVSLSKCSEALEKYSFKNQSGRQRGEGRSGSFLRKGESGDWANYFSREAAEIFDYYCGKKLIEMGYESNRKWIDHCK